MLVIPFAKVPNSSRLTILRVAVKSPLSVLLSTPLVFLITFVIVDARSCPTITAMAQAKITINTVKFLTSLACPTMVDCGIKEQMIVLHPYTLAYVNKYFLPLTRTSSLPESFSDFTAFL